MFFRLYLPLTFIDYFSLLQFMLTSIFKGSKMSSIDPILKMLVGLVIFFSLLLIAVARFMSSDGQTFQILSSLVSGFAGALLLRIKPRDASDKDVQPGVARETLTVEKQTTPPVAEPAK